MEAGGRAKQEQLPRGGNKIILYLFVITKEINFNSPHPTQQGRAKRKAMYPLNLAETHE